MCGGTLLLLQSAQPVAGEVPLHDSVRWDQARSALCVPRDQH